MTTAQNVMDNQYAQMEEAENKLRDYLENNKWAKYTMVGGSIIAAGALATSCVALGVYTYAGRDPEECWITNEIDQPGLSKAQVIELANANDIQVDEGFPVDIAPVFATWLVWGFYSKVATLGLLVLSGIFYAFCEKTAKVAVAITGGLYLINATVWVVMGGIWRFSRAGMVASGDMLDRDDDVGDKKWEDEMKSASARYGYQLSTGKFMKYYLYIASTALVLVLAVSIIYGFVSCCSSSPEDKGYAPVGQNDNEAGRRGERAEDEVITDAIHRNPSKDKKRSRKDR